MDWNKKIYEALREIEQALREEFAQRKQKSEATIVPDEWLTPHQVQRLLQISERTYRRRVQAGILIGEKIGDSRYFRRSEIDRLMEGGNGKWKR